MPRAGSSISRRSAGRSAAGAFKMRRIAGAVSRTVIVMPGTLRVAAASRSSDDGRGGPGCVTTRPVEVCPRRGEPLDGVDEYRPGKRVGQPEEALHRAVRAEPRPGGD